MTFPHGSWLAHPFQPDTRGTVGVSANRNDMIAQSIAAIVETRQGERVMVPDYGIPDFVFDVMDGGFAARLAYWVEKQIKAYEPLVDQVKTRVGSTTDGQFAPGFSQDEHRAAISIQFTARGSNTPTNLVFPIWRLR